MPDAFFEDMLGEFLDESDSLLSSLSDNLLLLDDWVNEIDPDKPSRCDDDLMNEMFRSAHSLKGLSGMMGLTDIAELTHKVENVFDAARQDELQLTPDIVELMFRAADRLGQMVEALKDPTQGEVAAGDIAQAIGEALDGAGVARDHGEQGDVEDVFEPASAESIEKSATEVPVDEPINTEQGMDEDPFDGIEDDFSAPRQYLDIFVDEATGSLDELADTLAAAEGPVGGEELEQLLVAAHRIKGSAAAVGMHRAAKLTHCMEDVLQELRDDKQPLVLPVAEQMLQCVDLLRSFVESLKAGSQEPADFRQALSDLRSSYFDSQTPTDGESTEMTAEPTTSQQPGLSQHRDQIVENAPAGSRGIVGVLVVEEGLPLAGLKGRLAYEKMSQIGEVFHFEPPVGEVADIDDLRYAIFGVVTDCSVDELKPLIDLAGIERIELEAFGGESESPPEKQPAAQSSDDVAAAEQAADATPPAADTSPKQAAEDSTPAAQADPARGGKAPDASKAVETIRVDIDRLDHLMNLAGQLVINKARFAQIGDSLKHLATRKQSTHAVGDVISTLKKLESGLSAKGDRLDPEVVRSHIRRIQVGLETVQRDVEQLGQSRSRVGDLLEAVHQLDRVSDSLQKSVMETRMVPIGPLFNRFKRVIRDISRSNGKDIRLLIQGEKTELDKRMIDALGDPLVHMIRNSADHGIETPEERRAAGKAEHGSVRLNAYHSGNSIVVQVSDDGRGLDPEKLIQRAVSKNIITRSDAEKLSPQQVCQLIWEPGFSTAEQITDVSGRGMGMDIVRSAIEDLNGNIDTESTLGQGTTFTIKLPLTLAILPSLLARIGDDVLAMPIETVVEIVGLPKDEFATVHGKLTARVRGRVVSVVDLFDVFDWRIPPRNESREAETTLVIVRAEGRELALIVDELLGEEDIVIKSVSENYRNVHGIAGASILGDGRVSLILDVPTIIEMAAASHAVANG